MTAKTYILLLSLCSLTLLSARDKPSHEQVQAWYEQGKALREQDIRICVLVLIGLPLKQIAEMLPCSQKSIGKLKDVTARKLGVSGGQLHKKLQDIVCEW